jgi:(p)ppGpp synthase/HD superfamily hydrolase
MCGLAVPGLALTLLLVGFGCAQKPAPQDTATRTTTGTSASTTTAATATLESARQAGQLAAAIEKEPARTAEILKEHGMTAESYQALLYDIAEDAALTNAYEAARTGS